ncbi:MAG: CPBP family intramembrane glutamic endopeptidase [Vulcanimicrobiaceae bacterium]
MRRIREIARVLFFGNGPGVRPLWRVLLFFWIGNALLWATSPLFEAATKGWSPLSPYATAVYELQLLIVAAFVTAIFGRFERRSVFDYGLPLAQAFRGTFWEGALVGFVAPALVGVAMFALGGFVIRGWNLHGTGWLVFPLGWIVTSLVVGFSEEFWYRGYMLQTLAKSLGFWPAAIVLSLLFTSDHYFYKANENIYDVITLFSLGLFTCLSVQRTGSLWFAIGFHAAFDFMQLFVIGTANGGLVPQGRLLDATFPGAAWVNGGPLGTEASVLMYPVIALLYAYLLWRYPHAQALRKYPSSREQGSDAIARPSGPHDSQRDRGYSRSLE